MDTTLKIGDRVCVKFRRSNGDWNISGATVGVILEVDSGMTRLSLLDSKRERYTKAWVTTSDLVADILWDSPLYSELK